MKGLAIPILLLCSCSGLQHKDVDIRVGEGGSAQLDIVQVKGVVHGPFQIKTRVRYVPLGGNGKLIIDAPSAPEPTPEPPEAPEVPDGE